MSHLSPALIAPCGMNCGLCIAYQREKNRCPGCREEDAKKSHYCARCRISHCEHLTGPFCSGCTEFPCARLKRLDQRYRKKYRMSMLANLQEIEEEGVSEFLNQEEIRWRCRHCKEIVSVHRDRCIHCGQEW
ncbi:MAG: DUF3795 domain-containing protein [Methanomicrobiaceae archaeon]|nr:DUF3795 domain-containing protein [Methanomicrobiaceae archaeon]